MLSVNVPPGEVRGVRVTRQSRKITQNVVYEDPPGSLYYWQDETVEWRGWRGSEGTRTWSFLTVAAARCTRAICSLSSSERGGTTNGHREFSWGTRSIGFFKMS